MWKHRIAGLKKLYHAHRIQQPIMKLRIQISTNFWPIRTKFSVSFIFYCFFRKKQSDWLKRTWKFRIRTIFRNWILDPVSKIFRNILTHEKRVGIPSIKTILCPSVRYISGGRDVHFWVLMFKKSLISQEVELNLVSIPARASAKNQSLYCWLVSCIRIVIGSVQCSGVHRYGNQMFKQYCTLC